MREGGREGGRDGAGNIIWCNCSTVGSQWLLFVSIECTV